MSKPVTPAKPVDQQSAMAEITAKFRTESLISSGRSMHEEYVKLLFTVEMVRMDLEHVWLFHRSDKSEGTAGNPAIKISDAVNRLDDYLESIGSHIPALMKLTREK